MQPILLRRCSHRVLVHYIYVLLSEYQFMETIEAVGKEQSVEELEKV